MALICLILASVGLWDVRNRALQGCLTLLSLFVISIYCGLRSFTSGVDTPSYVEYFYSDDGAFGKYEFGFSGFTYVFQLIGSPSLYLYAIVLWELLFLVIAARSLGVRSTALIVLAYVSFLPGLDMLTNGLRAGMALTAGAPLVVLTLVNRISSRYLNILPATIHLSFAMVAAVGFFEKRFASTRVNRWILCFSVIFGVLWMFVSPSNWLHLLDPFSDGYFGVSKLVTYILAEDEFMSKGVKAYFTVLSLSFSFLYIYVIGRKGAALWDVKLMRMAFITMTVQLVYMLLSFSGYAFRFMYIVYPLQVVMMVYILERYFRNPARVIVTTVWLLSAVVITYSTRTFEGYRLLNIF